MSESKHKPVALVSTVDTVGPDFPSHCVMLFDTEEEAVLYAVSCIVKHDPDVKFLEDKGLWQFKEDERNDCDDYEAFYDNPAEVLQRWQERLRETEYFHIKPVQTW